MANPFQINTDIGTIVNPYSNLQVALASAGSTFGDIAKERTRELELQKAEAEKAMLEKERLADRQYMLEQRDKLAKQEAAKDVFNRAVLEGPQVIGGIMTDRYNLQDQATKNAFEILDTDTDAQKLAKLKAQEEFSKNYTNIYDAGKINETRAEMIQRAAGLAGQESAVLPQEIVTQLDQARLAQEQAKIKALEDLQKEKEADAKIMSDLDYKLAKAMQEHGTGGSSGTVKGGVKQDEVIGEYNKAYDSMYEKVDKMKDVPEGSKNALKEQMQAEFDRAMGVAQVKGLTPNPTSLANSIATKVSLKWTPGQKEGVIFGDKVDPKVNKVTLQQLSDKELTQIPTAKFAYETQTVTGGSAPKNTKLEQAVLNKQREEILKRTQAYEAKKKALEMNPVERRNAEVDALLKGLKPAVTEAPVAKAAEKPKEKVVEAKPKEKKVIAKATVGMQEEDKPKVVVKDTKAEIAAIRKDMQGIAKSKDKTPAQKQNEIAVLNKKIKAIEDKAKTDELNKPKQKKVETAKEEDINVQNRTMERNALAAKRSKNGLYKGKTAEQWRALRK